LLSRGKKIRFTEFYFSEKIREITYSYCLHFTTALSVVSPFLALSSSCMHIEVLSFSQEGWGIITLFDVFPHLKETFLPTHHSANENSII
jgi:hypothetical protein